ncbi:MAG: methylenetetrahydrofolate--tRNA-(uracil(54)-C(5))-methyltransferase (FADH(2)-oxidizing) TrmFO [Syntrophaceae bacterium]|nr:methylenetetrahydrofolate--tRNA-(uracil(54)-C(5))-methyltransferase (FADH(2)-oxidizing) TrmFO [Syntrophaceae bacterium]
MPSKSNQGTESVTIIGGGLAGCEAAWQLLKRGKQVRMYEMKPERYSPAHRTPQLGELVCSNSLRSNKVENAVGLLKAEMRLLDSLIMKAADATQVPAGTALAVDRHTFANFIEETLSAQSAFHLIREEATSIPDEGIVIVSSGPLTSSALSGDIAGLTGTEDLYFYDAISPIVEADSLNYDKIFSASRYDQGLGDYLNCPLTEEEYRLFREKLLSAEVVPLKAFEEMKCFEGCLPIEVMAQRGEQTLLYGPMKPVGLKDPRTGEHPYAVIQLRRENKAGTLFNLVGFQTKMTYPEQRRVFRTIPGLENAEFVRYGSIHRNTYINSPTILDHYLNMQSDKRIFFAGQITGVEGYVESAAMGLWAGICAAACISHLDVVPPPPTTALGSLIHYITRTDLPDFQPMNVNFGLFEPLAQRKVAKRYRGMRYAERALEDIIVWRNNLLKSVR